MNSQPPQITGTAAVGPAVAGRSGGYWTGSPSPTFTYQWQDCDSGGSNCNPIAGATASSYTITSSDVGFDARGGRHRDEQRRQQPADVRSDGRCAQRRQPPVNTVPPSITGTVAVGQQLQASPGTLDGLAGADVQLPVAGLRQRRRQLRPIAAPRRAATRFRAATWAPRSRWSSPRRTAPAAAAATAPTASCRAGAGEHRSCRRSRGRSRSASSCRRSTGTWTGSPAPTFSYQWQDCDSGGNNCIAIAGATAQQLHDAGAMAASTLEVVVTATNSARQQPGGLRADRVVRRRR